MLLWRRTAANTVQIKQIFFGFESQILTDRDRSPTSRGLRDRHGATERFWQMSASILNFFAVTD
jgi:hypothetical protein